MCVCGVVLLFRFFVSAIQTIRGNVFKEKSYEDFKTGLELWLGIASLRGV